MPQVFDFFRREGAVFSHKAAQCAHFLAGNKVVLLQKTVSTGQYGSDVVVGLHGQQYDGHADEVGEEEAGQLADADVPTQEFPYQSVHGFCGLGLKFISVVVCQWKGSAHGGDKYADLLVYCFFV